MKSPTHRSPERAGLFAGLALAWLVHAGSVAAPLPLASPEDYFHGGALHYLTNNVGAALDYVTNGLARFPDNEKLRKLEALLKQQQQSQNQQDQQDRQNQNQQENPSQPKDEQKKSGDKDQQAKKPDQPQPDKEKSPPKDKSSEPKSKPDKPDEPQQPPSQPKPQPKPSKPGDSQSAASANAGVQAMTPEQAQRVLDMQKGDERVLPAQLLAPPANAERPLKDW